ncbi:hypothetical protein GHT09_002492 [Marmota monax]|uniref:Uncharacterized protein n=1 Tax=Marmota monax TaxID=9995 RepID=A0A834UP43_MARMO|nr:hypothetical protein GHT09_002492 [Marmota monax]
MQSALRGPPALLLQSGWDWGFRAVQGPDPHSSVLWSGSLRAMGLSPQCESQWWPPGPGRGRCEPRLQARMTGLEPPGDRSPQWSFTGEKPDQDGVPGELASSLREALKTELRGRGRGSRQPCSVRAPCAPSGITSSCCRPCSPQGSLVLRTQAILPQTPGPSSPLLLSPLDPAVPCQASVMKSINKQATGRMAGAEKSLQ